MVKNLLLRLLQNSTVRSVVMAGDQINSGKGPDPFPIEDRLEMPSW